MTIPYQPAGPYQFQTGKREGRSADVLIFTDPGKLSWMLQEMQKKSQGGKNRLHLHLEWLFQQAETRQPTMLCPQCKQGPVTQFSLYSNRFGISVGTSYTCCDEKECIEKVQAMAFGKGLSFLPFKWSEAMSFHNKADQRQVLNLFRSVFELPQRLTAQKAFEFFAS